MLFQLQVIPSPDDGFHMFMCRRKDMLTEEEKEKISEKHKDDPDPEEAAQQELDDYGANDRRADAAEQHRQPIRPEEQMIRGCRIKSSGGC